MTLLHPTSTTHGTVMYLERVTTVVRHSVCTTTKKTASLPQKQYQKGNYELSGGGERLLASLQLYTYTD